MHKGPRPQMQRLVNFGTFSQCLYKNSEKNSFFLMTKKLPLQAKISNYRVLIRFLIPKSITKIQINLLIKISYVIETPVQWRRNIIYCKIFLLHVIVLLRNLSTTGFNISKNFTDVKEIFDHIPHSHTFFSTKIF